MATEWEFEKIYADNYQRIYSFLYKMCRDGNVAEDLAQETFYQAYLAIPGFRGQCEMFTWLAAIAKNQYFRYLRRTRKESFLIDVYETEPNAPESDEPAYRILREIDINRVRKAVAALPKKYSDVLILRIYGELSYEEISKKLGISPGSAKVIYFRAKDRMKEMLKDD